MLIHWNWSDLFLAQMYVNKAAQNFYKALQSLVKIKYLKQTDNMQIGLPIALENSDRRRNHIRR